LLELLEHKVEKRGVPERLPGEIDPVVHDPWGRLSAHGR
jgi:hypothetical protein